MATKEALILIFHCYYKLGTISQHPLKLLYQDRNSADVKWGSRANTDSLFFNPPAAEGLLLLTQGRKTKTANHFCPSFQFMINIKQLTHHFFPHQCFGAYSTSVTDLTSWNEYFTEKTTQVAAQSLFLRQTSCHPSEDSWVTEYINNSVKRIIQSHCETTQQSQKGGDTAGVTSAQAVPFLPTSSATDFASFQQHEGRQECLVPKWRHQVLWEFINSMTIHKS